MLMQRSAIIFLLICVTGSPAACTRPQSDAGPTEQKPNREASAVSDTITIEAAQQELTERLLPLPGVEGTGIGECDGSPCILVLLAQRTDELMDQIPSTFHGYRVESRVMGEFHPRED